MGRAALPIPAVARFLVPGQALGTARNEPFWSLSEVGRSMDDVVTRDRGQRTVNSSAQKNMMQSP